MPTKKEKTLNFKIGADPEFVMVMQNKKVDAKKTMELMVKGLTEKNGGFEVPGAGNFGWDGASSTGEIRPNAEDHPQKITSNINKLFKEMIKYIKICDLSTISEYSSVGGHIHFQIPKGETWSIDKRNNVHRKLASFFLPIMISENKTNLALRLTQGYGAVKDSRYEEKFKYPDGTPGYTLEFRCPSAEWLTTPKITRSTFAYMATIYNEIINNPKNMNKFSDIIYRSDKQGDALQTLTILEYDTLTDALLSKIKKYIKTFELYNQYKTEIEYILNPSKVIKDKKKADYNISIGWGLVKKEAPKKKEFLASDKKIEEISKTKDFDMLKNIINIHYNNDTNVSIFAEALKNRIIAYNWKIRNNYFIFGMRKGLKNMIIRNAKGNYITGINDVKTILDDDQITKLFQKMQVKFNNSEASTRINTLDFTTGKIKDIRESIILIGLPYEQRIKKDTKEFLSFIWDFEANKLKEQDIKNKEIIYDIDKPVEERGEIYKILTKQTEQTQEQQVIIDEGSISMNNHQRACNDLREELERESVVSSSFLEEETNTN